VDSIKGDFLVKPVHVTDDPAEAGKVDVVLVGVKAWQVPEAAEAMRPLEFQARGQVKFPN
jgi:2-dehydropantoate 2-reductase